MTDEPIESLRDALERAVWLTVTAPDRERMIAAGKIAMELCRSMTEEDVLAVMDIIDERVKTLERRTFGNVFDELKPH